MSRHFDVPWKPRHRRRSAGWIGVGLAAALAIGAATVATIYAAARIETGAAYDSLGPVEHVRPVVEYRETVIPEPGPVSFTVVASGDVLPHGPVNNSARTGSTWDYTPLMANIRPWIEGADLALCHLEVPVAPPGTVPSGYPVFGSPDELVRDLKEEGWDGCSTASNHSVDRGWSGLVATLNTLDAHRMGHVGTARSAKEQQEPQIYNIRTGSRIVQIAHLSYTYALNGLPKPSNRWWSVNTYPYASADVSGVIADAERARAEGAEVVIVSMHCCVEYRTQPMSYQRRAAETIAASGQVDLLIGHHAHVPSPIEKLSGGPYGDGMWSVYGLGNYLSNQDTQCCIANTNSGAIAIATFTVELDGTVEVGMEWKGITVDRLDRHTMHVLSASAGSTDRLSQREMRARYGRVLAAIGSTAPEATEPPDKLADYMYRDVRKPWAPGD